MIVIGGSLWLTERISSFIWKADALDRGRHPSRSTARRTGPIALALDAHRYGTGGLIIFIVSGSGEAALVSRTCRTPVAALEQARLVTDQGVRDMLIDANGQEYSPADFTRLFVEPDLTDDQEGEIRPDDEL